MNPYKGLLAFQETDRDRFFGRDEQIDLLWGQLCQLYDRNDKPRLLPVYGPSGSGKSSLVRAGLIPELARRSLLGYEAVQVAVLTPQSRPLESLAIVLAKIATGEPAPLAKSKEFERGLAESGDRGDFDGLRRIAALLPKIQTAPLLVLVDQFEEIYSLCEEEEQRRAFVGNLLHAAADRDRQVSVMVTLRSDFLGATQQHPLLNQLFSEQGHLVPALDESGLRDAIALPAKNAGRALDDAAIELLIAQTAGREGALPLLQFALEQIWEGLREGKEPVQTLEAIGGVGGALAAKAEEIFARLKEGEKEIARRIFLGLVQLGEGTRDTRRRASLESLRSRGVAKSEFEEVLQRFARPTARLIALSSESDRSEGVRTAEVTHEALLDNWQQLRDWLGGSRDDLRFLRRLEDSAKHWDSIGREEGSLWRSPDLDVLREFCDRAGEETTALQMAFFEASVAAEEKQKREKRWQLRRFVAVLCTGLIGTTTVAGVALYQLQQSLRQQIETTAASAKLTLSVDPIVGALESLAAFERSQSPFIRFPNYPPSASVRSALISSVQIARERYQFPHFGVYSVAISGNGKILVSSGNGDKVKLWNIESGENIISLSVRMNSISSVAISDDGKLAVGGSHDGTVKLWDIQRQKEIASLSGHQNWVSSVAISGDGKLLVSSGDGTVKLWNVQRREEIASLSGHQNSVGSVAISGDGKLAVGGSHDGTVKLWDIQRQKEIASLGGHQVDINSIAISGNGKIAVSSGEDGMVKLWDIQKREEIASFQGSISSVAISSDGKIAVGGSLDSTVKLWDVRKREEIASLSGYQGWVSSITISDDGKIAVSSSPDSQLKLWDVQRREEIASLSGHQNWVTSVAISGDDQIAVSSSLDRTVKLWDVQRREEIASLSGHQNEVTSVAISGDGRIAVSGSEDSTVKLWNVQKQEEIASLSGHEDEVTSVAISGDGKIAVSGSKDSTVKLWDVQKQEEIASFSGYQSMVRSVSISDDGKIVVSGDEDSTVKLWDVQKQEEIASFSGYQNLVSSVAISDDGKIAVSGSGDHTLIVWDVGKQEEIATLYGHQGAILSVDISSDGKTVVSSSFDNIVKVWDVEGQKEIASLSGHYAPVSSVAISSDGKTVVSGGSEDGTVKLWDISTEGWVQILCSRVRHLLDSNDDNNELEVVRDAKRTCDRTLAQSK